MTLSAGISLSARPFTVTVRLRCENALMPLLIESPSRSNPTAIIVDSIILFFILFNVGGVKRIDTLKNKST